MFTICHMFILLTYKHTFCTTFTISEYDCKSCFISPSNHIRIIYIVMSNSFYILFL